MKKTFKATVELSPEDVRNIIREHYKLGPEEQITFVVTDVGDDRSWASHELTSVKLDVNISEDMLKAPICAR